MISNNGSESKFANMKDVQEAMGWIVFLLSPSEAGKHRLVPNGTHVSSAHLATWLEPLANRYKVSGRN